MIHPTLDPQPPFTAHEAYQTNTDQSSAFLSYPEITSSCGIFETGMIGSPWQRVASVWPSLADSGQSWRLPKPLSF
jgi:hypothetical protein